MITIIPIADAQVTIGEWARQKSIEVVISSVGDVHVTHIVPSPNIPKQIEFIPGTVSNLSVTNKQGEENQFAVIGNNAGVMILPSGEDSIVEYDLEQALSKKNDVWVWDFLYLQNVAFIFPEEVDLIFLRNNPVDLSQNKGIMCHGCQTVLEYSINEPKIFKDIKWEDKEFVIEIKSHSNIDEFVFEQSTKSITFDVLQENEFVTATIPLELLWNPYSVFLDNEKIHAKEYANNGTHVGLSMRPETTGEISIIGTTVIPEFPIIAPLAIGFLIMLVIPLIRKVNLR